MKNIILSLLILFTYGCGYTSIYKSQILQDIQIKVISVEGDNEFNNMIKNQLNLYSSKQSQNKYDLKIKSKFEKIVISKNASGIATDFNLLLITNISVIFNKKVENFEFEESVNIKNNTNSFEQNNYEKNIKRNFASTIREKLIIKIININDS